LLFSAASLSTVAGLTIAAKVDGMGLLDFFKRAIAMRRSSRFTQLGVTAGGL